MVRIEDVAARAGVSAGTVSNVLNRPHAVTPKTRKRVQAAIAELGYLPSEAARALAAGSSRTIGLIVPDVTNPFFADLARGAEGIADNHDVIVMLYNSAECAERERRYLGHLETQRVQGVLTIPVDLTGGAITALIGRGTPVVLLGRGCDLRDVCSVAVDDHHGGELAATHLIERGHRRIAFVGGPPPVPHVRNRLAGAREVVQAAGATLEVIETPSLTVDAGRGAISALAGRPTGTRPTALFCANDVLALGALQAATRSGLRVPQDLAIVGYDDIDFASGAAVPLTSVRQPREHLGRVAAELLFEEIAKTGQHSHRQVVFRPDLVARDSSDAPPGRG